MQIWGRGGDGGTYVDPESVAKKHCDRLCRAKLKSLEGNDNAGGGMSSDIDDDGDYSSIDGRDPKMEIKNGVGGMNANGVTKSDLLMRYETHSRFRELLSYIYIFIYVRQCHP